jgi:HlyD family secretion protein
MQSKKKNSKQSRRGRILIPILILLVLAAAGGYWYYNQNLQNNAAQADQANSASKTAVVRNGNITLAASGSGTLTAKTQTGLSFSTPGTVAVLNVKVGDQVKKGQVLAQLDNLDTLKTGISAAEQDLISAQTALQTLTQSASANVGNAQLALATAQKAYTDAKSKVVQKGMARCDQPTIDLDYQKYLLAQDHLNQVMKDGSGNDYYTNYVVPAKNDAARAYSIYIWCTGFTDYEINSSNANVTITKANLDAAQATLDTLQKNNGVDPLQLATAKNKVENAQLALDKANQTLAGATLVAPYDGVILTVSGQLGDTAGTNAFITIADLAHPQILFSIDETDLGKLALDEKATVVFDSLPNRTFNAKVVQINPVLQSVNNYKVVQGTAELDLSNEKDIPTLAAGMSATLQIINGEAQNVPLVPVQALRDLGNGQYAVFVVTNGQPRLKTISVGLMDTSNAEVKEGLKEGDIVTTGVAQVTTRSAGGNSSGGGNGNGN